MQQLIIAVPLIFIAGFIDAIAGGGGLISLPTFYLIGLPPHIAMGTNKFSASMGTIVATIQYIKGKYIKKEIILTSVVTALIGAYLGSRLALFIDEIYLKYIMIVLVPLLGIFVITRKGFLEGEKEELDIKKANLLSGIFSFFIGGYDGFFGPGTGVFLMIAYTSVIGLNVVTACGNTKVVNLASTVASVVAFALAGKIAYAIAIPCAIASILGGYLGSKLAIKRGLKVIKPVMLIVIILLTLSVGRDVLMGVIQ